MLALALAPAPRCMGPDLPPPQLLADVLDAPPAGDRYRFPPPAVVERSAWFAYRFRRNLLARIPWERERGDLLLAAHHASWRHWWAWEILYYADREETDWRVRLRLAELRALIGEDAYRRGVLPEPVPGCLFHDLR